VSKQNFADKLDAVSNSTITAAGHDAEVDGIQSEFEDRDEASKVNGVLSGLTPSISDTNIAVASGEAYCEGKRYSGAGVVAFNGAGAGTYYVYVDPADDAAPYKKSLTAPGTGLLTLGSVVWSGAALSSLLDLREWGTVIFNLRSYYAGSVLTGVAIPFYVPADMWIEDVVVTLGNRPTGSTVIVDLRWANAGGTPTTVFSQTMYRVQIPTTLSSLVPTHNTGYIANNRLCTAGQVLYISVDQGDSSSQATQMDVCIRGRVYGKSS